jgi:hypothetical protein
VTDVRIAVFELLCDIAATARASFAPVDGNHPLRNLPFRQGSIVRAGQVAGACVTACAAGDPAHRARNRRTG